MDQEHHDHDLELEETPADIRAAIAATRDSLGRNLHDLKDHLLHPFANHLTPKDTSMPTQGKSVQPSKATRPATKTRPSASTRSATPDRKAGIQAEATIEVLKPRTDGASKSKSSAGSSNSKTKAS